jgi:predicted esterase
VGGFSQGCAIALSYGISCEPPVAGIIGYSGHLFKSTPLRNIGKTPILLYHGLEDPLLREKESKYSY